jgi:hypothetical protein
MVKKYLKKPIMIEALEFDGSNLDEVKSFIEERKRKADKLTIVEDDLVEGGYELILPNGQGIGFKKGDFLVQGVDGSIYPVHKNTFWKAYETLDDDKYLSW